MGGAGLSFASMNEMQSIAFSPDDIAAAARIIAAVEAGTTVRDVEHAGTRVRWRSAGEGPPLVLLHGGHGSWRHWIRNVQALARRYTVWLPDLPSYGESGTLPPPGDWDQLIATTAATLDQLVGAHTEIHLAGFSFGGLCAARLAAHRGHVDRLALLGAAGHGTPRRQQTAMVNWRRASGEQALLDDLRHNLRALMLHDERRIEALAMAVHRQACETTRFRSKALSLGNAMTPLLDQFSMPMLLLWGEHDVTAYPDRVGPMWVQGRPERTWRVVADAGHWVQFEQAEEVNGLLLEFFG